MAFDQSETKLDYTNIKAKPELKIGQISKEISKNQYFTKEKIITERCGSQGKKNFSLLLFNTLLKNKVSL